MFWSDHLVQGIEGPQTINDSKTPSGHAHVGALRGPLIHDAIFRTLKARGVTARYLFGSDDYDPVDEIPYGEREHFEKYLGVPLCNVPAPPGSSATDMADHYISEFWGVFRELGIDAELYRMRDIYRSGRFNEAIDVILRHADLVRQIYKKVSGANRPSNWHPFQVICENCGRIGTTEVTSYDGKEVTYECRRDLVKWAVGCGYRGKISPFNGNGKLPWKLEWAAKWRTFPVTIEGAGQDHSTKGGSRDVAMACLEAIFGQKPPMNCPYEFFLVGGAKMSSSRGVGVSARGMADFLPPEVLRFLMVRTRPSHHVDFDSSEVRIVKLFNEFDRYHHRYFHDPKITLDEKRVYEVSRVAEEPEYWTADFQLVTALIQLPHIDVVTELERRKGSPFTDRDLRHLQIRIRAAEYWVRNFARDDEKTRLQEVLPSRAYELSATQRGFLHAFAEIASSSAWNADDIQASIFSAARLTPIDQPSAFKALYRTLLDRDSGPKAGNLLSFLDRVFVIRRCRELPIHIGQFWAETSISQDAFEQWLAAEIGQVKRLRAKLAFAFDGRLALPDYAADQLASGLGVVEFIATMMDDKAYLKRVLFEHVRAFGPTPVQKELNVFETYAREWIGDLQERMGLLLESVEGVYEPAKA